VERYPINNAAALKNAVQELQQRAASKTKMLNLLTRRNNFSSYLLGLANVTMQGVWLTEMNFNNLDQTILLRGVALQTELVGKILSQLDIQPAFKNFKFEIQNITEEHLPPRFEISAKQETSS
jgi:hypothetical protein